MFRTLRQSADTMMDYEEDAHFCLKCHTTIMGLDNYVAHRKAACNKVDPKSPLLPPEEVEEIGLKADDFFSSLELRSSSKKPVQSTSGKNFSGILTRSKITAVLQASNAKEPVEPAQSKSGKNVWIGGNQLKDLGTGDNQSKLIKAVANLERRKEAAPPESPPRIGTVYEDSDEDSELYDYEEEESSEEDYEPPRGHTGGKWKPSSPLSWGGRDWIVPPPSFTGGKWRPKRLTPPPTYTKGKWKPAEEEVPPMGGKFPPPGHTRGKWKPPSRLEQEEEAHPPPNYTKGKWKPRGDEEELEARQEEEAKKKSPAEPKKKNRVRLKSKKPSKSSKTSPQYWCSPCNRRLASKLVYERHLRSELHSKRSKVLLSPPPDLPKPSLSPPTLQQPTKRLRRRLYEVCAVCRSKVKKALIGKHLISHYHCRRGDLNSEANRQMVLDNILGVVLESPFQCNVCQFFCNTHDQFLAHWQSEWHLEEGRKRPGYFLCTFCQHKAADSEAMLPHLQSSEHLEVVSVINRSVPIAIRKITEVACLTCGASFLLNRQLLSHCRLLSHDAANVEAPQQCKRCQKSFASALSLQQHLRKKHQQSYYFCSACALRFDNSAEAKKHRMSMEHRYARLQQCKPQDGRLRRRCEYCAEVFANFLLLKEHLRARHPEHKVRCPQCGAEFIVPQELTNHLKSKSCSFPTASSSSSKELRCDQCAFSSNSSSELLFHVALHGEPLLPDKDSAGAQAKPKFKCPLCEKFFPKSSLQPHLRIHTEERPFVCATCNATFARRNNLLFHQKNHQRRPQPKRSEGKDDRAFLCSTCGAGFNRRFTLQQHMLIHSGKGWRCPQVGCVFNARKKSELDEHVRTHSSQRNFSCDLCEYRSKTKKLLKRHMSVHEPGKRHECSVCAFAGRTAGNLRRHARLHTGAKPFKCPYCDFKCNDMDNLRRHVLSTSKHPGKCVYECKFCKEAPPFQSNAAKDFKAHLLLNHSEEFGDGGKAASYVGGIYEAHEDNTFLMEVDNLDDPPEEGGERCSRKGAKLTTNKDPVVAQLSQPNELPLLIIPDTPGLAPWSLIGRYDVEESGILVPFQSGEEDDLFQEHF